MSESGLLKGVLTESNRTGQAPAIFQTCNQQGVPWVAVAASTALGCLAYLSVSNGSTVAFNWFLNLTTVSGYGFN